MTVWVGVGVGVWWVGVGGGWPTGGGGSSGASLTCG